jgi:hypothetical protein
MRPVDVHQSLHAQGEVFQLKYLAQQAGATGIALATKPPPKEG